LELVDNEGRRTGINADGQIQEQIPGTYFKQFGDVKYIFADENISSHVEMKGYDSGTFTFAIKELKGDEEIDEIVFKDMPTTSQTKVTFAVPENLESVSNLEIDKDGDGTADFSFEPKIGEIVMFDLEPPTTELAVSGTPGENGWHVSDVLLNLSAIDNENGSGVFETNFSLNDGATWEKYLEPITISREGVSTIRFFSVDKNGNSEAEKVQTIKIDKTAPEARMTFNLATQKLDIIGMDNLSQNVLMETKEQSIFVDGPQPDKKNKFWHWAWFQKPKEKKIIVTATLIDQAGHETEIAWEKKHGNDHRIDLAISSISYDGQKTNINKGILQYKWMQNWRKNKYQLFASHLGTSSMSIESHYFSSKNQTWLMEKPTEIADDDDNDNAERRPVWKKMPGMIIPSIITEKGILKINY